MSKKDAMLFPVIGSAVLLGLYIVIKVFLFSLLSFFLFFRSFFVSTDY